MILREYKLNDTQAAALLRLGIELEPATRLAVERAEARLTMYRRYPDLGELAGLIAELQIQGRADGILGCRYEQAHSCLWCQRDFGTKQVKRGRGRNAYTDTVLLTERCVDFKKNWITIKGHVALGCCMQCFERVESAAKAELAHEFIELPNILQTSSAPRWKRYDRRRCKACGWEGHEGEMGQVPALIEGSFPGVCPKCNVRQLPLGPSIFEHLDGFNVVRLP